jgi:hypothetical protein
MFSTGVTAVAMLTTIAVYVVLAFLARFAPERIPPVGKYSAYVFMAVALYIVVVKIKTEATLKEFLNVTNAKDYSVDLPRLHIAWVLVSFVAVFVPVVYMLLARKEGCKISRIGWAALSSATLAVSANLAFYASYSILWMWVELFCLFLAYMLALRWIILLIKKKIQYHSY